MGFVVSVNIRQQLLFFLCAELRFTGVVRGKKFSLFPFFPMSEKSR